MKYFNIFKGRVGDLVQKHYAGRKSLHMSIALIKLSGVNVFISSVEGVGSKKTLSNQNVRSEHYDRLSYLPVSMYLHTSAHPVCTDMIRHQRIRALMKGAIIVTLSTLYWNVFSAVNETWGNLTALHSIFHQRGLSSCCRLVSGLPEHVCVLEEAWLCRVIMQGWWGSCFQS